MMLLLHITPTSHLLTQEHNLNFLHHDYSTQYLIHAPVANLVSSVGCILSN